MSSELSHDQLIDRLTDKSGHLWFGVQGGEQSCTNCGALTDDFCVWYRVNGFDRVTTKTCQEIQVIKVLGG